MQVAVYGQKVAKHNLAVFKRFFEKMEAFGWKVVLEKNLLDQLNDKNGMDLKYDCFTSHEDFKTGIDFVFQLVVMVLS